MRRHMRRDSPAEPVADAVTDRTESDSHAVPAAHVARPQTGTPAAYGCTGRLAVSYRG